jgi:hypothetical protein
MAEFRLSTLDQNAPRVYLRYALCFACNSRQHTVISERLQRVAKSLVSEVPMLAGVVTTNKQQKPTSVTVTPNQIEEFTATITHLEGYTQSYQDLCHSGFAPRHIKDVHLTPLANVLEGNHSPSCAIQANFIDGGLILVIELHHAVADINGVSTILRLMSEGLPPRIFDHNDLRSEATVVSEARSRLSQGSGAPAFLCLARNISQRMEQSRQYQHQQFHPNNRDDTTTVSSNGNPNNPSTCAAIFTFRLDTLLQVTEMLNSRRTVRSNLNSTTSSPTTTTTTDNLTPRDAQLPPHSPQQPQFNNILANNNNNNRQPHPPRSPHRHPLARLRPNNKSLHPRQRRPNLHLLPNQPPPHPQPASKPLLLRKRLPPSPSQLEPHLPYNPLQPFHPRTDSKHRPLRRLRPKLRSPCALPHQSLEQRIAWTRLGSYASARGARLVVFNAGDDGGPDNGSRAGIGCAARC